MPIDPSALGYRSAEYENHFDQRDVMLYALGVGADTHELLFTTENSAGITLKTLPTFAVVATGTPPLDLWAAAGRFDLSQLLHGEQSVELFSDIPTQGTIVSTTEIVGIYDKGSAAVVVTETTAKDKVTQKALFKLTSSAFIKGEGNFNGDRGPSAAGQKMPDQDPDLVVSYQTSKDQALLYRLSGDRNPLHSDPSFAKLAGFDRPILHGLCSFGFTGRALVNSLCASDTSKFGLMSARFITPVFPGDRLDVKIWKRENGGLFRTESQRGDVVIDFGLFKTRA